MRWAFLFLVAAIAAGLYGYGVIDGKPRDAHKLAAFC